MVSQEEREARLQAILDTAVDGIITIDRHGIIESFNLAAERIFAYKACEVMGRNIKMLMPEPDQSAHDGYLRNYHRSGVAKIIGIGRELRGLRKDGKCFPMALSVSEVKLAPGTLFTGIVRDISQRKKAEEALSKANVRLEELDHLKSMFIASMSHELRTPLNSIIGFTGIILHGISGEINADQKDQLKRVYASAQHLLELISDIIDISKIEAGKIDIYRTRFPLHGLMTELVANLKSQIEDKGLSLEIKIPQQIELHCDRLRLTQCMLNYLSNALKFTQKGRISIVAEVVGKMIEIRVQDTGIGIKATDLSKLFSPFSRFDTPLKPAPLGTGLGLYLTKKLADEVLNASVAVESEYGTGSTFILKMPVDSEGHEAAVL